ncbi:MAG: ABC transporter ATP-binding protein, partial [Chitinophagales bacterium]
MKNLLHLNKYFYKYRWRLLLGILFVTMSNVFGVLPPQVIRHAFNLVKENIEYYHLYSGFELQSSFYGVFSSAVIFFGLAVVALAIMKGIFMFFMRQTMIVMSRLIEYDFRNEIYEHYQKLTTAFYKRHRTGDMMSRITEDVSRVRMYLGPALMYSVNLTVLIVIVVSTMLQVNVELTLYALIPLPILSVSIYYVNTIINRRSEEIQRQLSNLTSIAQESYSGIRVLKAYTQEKATDAYFDKESESYKEKSLKLATVQALFFPLMMVLVGASIIITIYIGGQQVINGYLTSGNIAEFVIYINMLTWPVMSIGWVASIIQRAEASQERINEFLKTEPEVASPNNDALTLKGKVAMDKVSFTYPDTGIEALKEVSFELKSGEKMALIGRTGSGKSTIAELLVRKYDTTEGQILMDDADVRDLNLSALRAQIGYVP